MTLSAKVKRVCVCAAMHCFYRLTNYWLYCKRGGHKRSPADKTSNSALCCLIYLLDAGLLCRCTNPDPSPFEISSAQVCVVGVSFIRFTLFTMKQIHRPAKVWPVDFQLQISVKRLRLDSCSSGEQYNLVIWAGCENAHFLFFFSLGDNRILLLWFGFCRVCIHLDEEQWGMLVVKMRWLCTFSYGQRGATKTLHCFFQTWFQA